MYNLFHQILQKVPTHWKAYAFISTIIAELRPVSNTMIFFNKIKNLIGIKRLINYCLRPKLEIDIKPQTVWFSKDGFMIHPRLFCVLIKNKSKKNIYLNLNEIHIGNRNYRGFCPPEMRDFNDSESKICIEFIKKNNQIHNGNTDYVVPHMQTEILPTLGESHTYNSEKNSSLLFFSNKKIPISLNINGKLYAYACKKMIVHPRLIDYLSNKSESITLK